MLKGRTTRSIVAVLVAAAFLNATIATAYFFWQRARVKEIDALVAKLGDKKQRDEAEKQLAAVTDSAGTRRIVLHMGDESYDVRDSIVRIVGKIGGRAVGPLADATRGYYAFDHARYTSSAALQWVYGKWPQMVPGRDYEKWGQYALLHDAYGKIGAPARGALIEMLSEEYLQAAALSWLGDIGDPRDLDLFISYAGCTRDSSAAGNAIGALGEIKAARDGRREADLSSNDPAWRAFDLREGGVVQILIQKLKDSGGNTRSSAAHALGEYRDSPAGVATLLAVVEDAKESSWVRISAARALQYAGYPAVTETIYGFLGDSDLHLRHAAAISLDNDGDSATPRRVAGLLGSSDALLRESAIYFFTERWEEDDIPILVKAFEDLNDVGRQNTILILERIHDGAYTDVESGFHGMEEVWVEVTTEPDFRRAAEEALRQIGVLCRDSSE